MASQKFKQGYYTPKHPEKYIGDVTKIFYRSSWEIKVFFFLDNNNSIINWSSENISIEYYFPIDKKVHRYYPDLWIKYKDRNGVVKQELIEIKPKKQTKPPRNGKKSKNLLFEQITYIQNQCKWEAAVKWCKDRGLTFRVITEDQIFK